MNKKHNITLLYVFDLYWSFSNFCFKFLFMFTCIYIYIYNNYKRNQSPLFSNGIQIDEILIVFIKLNVYFKFTLKIYPVPIRLI